MPVLLSRIQSFFLLVVAVSVAHAQPTVTEIIDEHHLS